MIYSIRDLYPAMKTAFLYAYMMAMTGFPTGYGSVNTDSTDQRDRTRILFYNVENLFHPSNDSLTRDDDFTPQGSYYWTYRKYDAKISRLAKLIIAIGDGSYPGIIGLCEIENRKVLVDLLDHVLIRKAGYKIIHKESHDVRGIDVAMIYDPKIYRPDYYETFTVPRGSENHFNTRDILYVHGYFLSGHECNIFINHWPSRRGGKLASDPRRIIMATLLKNKVDSLFNDNPQSNILIMGDFNDEPVDRSIIEILDASEPVDNPHPIKLYNLMYPSYKKGEGTHYRFNNFYEAGVLDQIIVSGNLLTGQNGMSTTRKEGQIFKRPFLINQKNGLPLRTYQGLKYLGGISDHFPVYIDVNLYK